MTIVEETAFQTTRKTLDTTTRYARAIRCGQFQRLRRASIGPADCLAISASSYNKLCRSTPFSRHQPLPALPTFSPSRLPVPAGLKTPPSGERVQMTGKAEKPATGRNRDLSRTLAEVMATLKTLQVLPEMKTKKGSPTKADVPEYA